MSSLACSIPCTTRYILVYTWSTTVSVYFVPSSELGPPPPQPRASVYPPGGRTRLRLRGGGLSQFGRLGKSLALCLLCAMSWRHKVLIYKKFHSVCPLVGDSELGLSHPFSRQRVCHSPRSKGGHTRLRVRGWGSLNSDEGEKSQTHSAKYII